MHTIAFSFLLRRLILITLLVLPQRFWFWRGWKLSTHIRGVAWRLVARVFLALAIVAIALVLYDRVSFHFLPQSVSAWIAPPVQLWVFTSTFAFLCIKIIHAAEWVWLIFKKLYFRARPKARTLAPDNADLSRRSFFRYAAAFVGTMPFLAAIYGFARERLNFEIVRVDVPIANLPPALDGFRIVQLSDIHAGDFMPPDEIRRAVDMANALQPQLAVVTGDFISDHGDPLAACISELSGLKAALGVWGCNGNHEIYAAAEDAVESLFRSHGMTLLRSASTQLDWNGESINLLGVDYQREIELTGSRMPHLHGIEPLVRRDVPNILLSHNPNSFYRAAELGIELTISGHTHGGQINFEIVNHSLSPARFMTKFIAGLYHRPMQRMSGQDVLMPVSNPAPSRAYLYVNRGLGTLGIPARIGAQPEITLLTLRRT